MSKKIIVVGAGVAGLSAACGLQRLGYAVTVLDRAAAPASPSGPMQARVSAFSPASMAFLQELDAWPQTEDRIRHYGDMFIWTDGDFDSIHFSANELGKTSLGAIAENSLLQCSLIQAAGNAGVQLRWQTEWRDLSQSDQAVVLSLASGESLTADWLLVAEGAQSGLRDLLGIRSRGWAYHQQAIVCAIKWQQATSSRSPDELQPGLQIDHTAWQRFLPTGPLALLPLATGESSLVWSLEHDDYERLQALDDGAFVDALNEALADVTKHKAVSISQRFGFPLRLAQSEQYMSGRCLLLGDAAHSVHPLAGQGLNLGLMDARDLVAAFAQGASPSQLAAWQRKRRAKAAEMMLLTDALYRLYRLNAGSPSLQTQRPVGRLLAAGLARGLLSAGMASFGSISLIKQELARLAISAD